MRIGVGDRQFATDSTCPAHQRSARFTGWGYRQFGRFDGIDLGLLLRDEAGWRARGHPISVRAARKGESRVQAFRTGRCLRRKEPTSPPGEPGPGQTDVDGIGHVEQSHSTTVGADSVPEQVAASRSEFTQPFADLNVSEMTLDQPEKCEKSSLSAKAKFPTGAGSFRPASTSFRDGALKRGATIEGLQRILTQQMGVNNRKGILSVMPEENQPMDGLDHLWQRGINSQDDEQLEKDLIAAERQLSSIARRPSFNDRCCNGRTRGPLPRRSAVGADGATNAGATPIPALRNFPQPHAGIRRFPTDCVAEKVRLATKMRHNGPQSVRR